MNEDELRYQIGLLVDTYLPPEGVGTQRESDRMNLLNGLICLYVERIRPTLKQAVLVVENRVNHEILRLMQEHKDELTKDFRELPEVKQLLVVRRYLVNIQQ